jgi:hypothetical protein
LNGKKQWLFATINNNGCGTFDAAAVIVNGISPVAQNSPTDIFGQQFSTN